MHVGAVLRYVILTLSVAAMGVGVAMMAGWIKTMRHLPGEYSLIFGAVVFLYGAYRFSIAFFRNKGRQDHEI